MGTETGALHCLVTGETDKKERLWALLLELDTPTPAVHGCYQQVQALNTHIRSLPGTAAGAQFQLAPS